MKVPTVEEHLTHALEALQHCLVHGRRVCSTSHDHCWERRSLAKMIEKLREIDADEEVMEIIAEHVHIRPEHASNRAGLLMPAGWPKVRRKSTR